MKMIFALLSLCTSSALAVSTTQQNLMPAASQNEINAHLGLAFAHFESKTNTEADAVGALVEGTYYYGLSATQAIGVGTYFSSSTSEQKYSGGSTDTSTSKGLRAISLLYKGNFDLGYPTLFVQGGLNLTPGERTTENKSNGDSESNSANGSNQLVATVGMIFPTEAVNSGFSVSYIMNAEGKYKDTSSSGVVTKGKSEGGNESSISAFAELNNSVHPNLALTYTRGLTRKDTPDSGTGSTTTYGLERIALQGSVRFVLNSNIELLPYMNMASLLDGSRYDIDQYTVFTTGVIGRFLF